MKSNGRRRGRVKVVQVTHDLGIGGLPRVVETLCRHLDPSRFEVEVLCLRDGGPLADRLAEVGIPSFVLDRPPTRLRADYFAAFRIAKYFRERRPTIVHTHNTEPFVEGGFAAKISGVPILVHTDHARVFPDLKRLMFMERVMSHFSDYVAAVSEDGKDNLRRYIRVPERKLVTVLNGVDALEVKTDSDTGGFRARLGIPPEAPVIGLGARFEEQKGLGYLMKAMPRILRSHPETHAILAGYGPCEDDLKAEADALGVAHRVHFVGKLDSMADLLTCLDVFLLPSLWEGLPMAILEAMAAGVPIVATTVGGVAGALEDGRSAVLVPAADADAFAEGVEKVLGSEELRRSLARHARKRFEEEFSAQAMAGAYADLYEAALAARGLGPA